MGNPSPTRVKLVDCLTHHWLPSEQGKLDLNLVEPTSGGIWIITCNTICDRQQVFFDQSAAVDPGHLRHCFVFCRASKRRSNSALIAPMSSG